MHAGCCCLGNQTKDNCNDNSIRQTFRCKGKVSSSVMCPHYDQLFWGTATKCCWPPHTHSIARRSYHSLVQQSDILPAVVATQASTYCCSKQEIDADQSKAPSTECCIHCGAQNERIEHARPCKALQQHRGASDKHGSVYSCPCCPTGVCCTSLLQQSLKLGQCPASAGLSTVLADPGPWKRAYAMFGACCLVCVSLEVLLLGQAHLGSVRSATAPEGCRC